MKIKQRFLTQGLDFFGVPLYPKLVGSGNRGTPKNMFNFFTKTKKLGLERAKEMGLISEGEFLRLKSERADNRLKKYLAKNNKKKK